MVSQITQTISVLAAEILYLKVVLSGGKNFNTDTPKFGLLGISQSYESIDEISIKNGEEFAVVANRMAKGMKHLSTNPNDFYHPEKIQMETDEEYYIITLQFVK